MGGFGGKEEGEIPLEGKGPRFRLTALLAS